MTNVLGWAVVNLETQKLHLCGIDDRDVIERLFGKDPKSKIVNLIDEQLLLDAQEEIRKLKADADRMHNLFPDEKRRSIDYHFALCKVNNEQAQWLMRFSKYGDSTDRALYKELNRRDQQIQRFRELIQDIRNSKSHPTTEMWFAEIDAVVKDIDVMVGK